MSGYDAFEDPNCYPNTNVLKNKAGLQDAAALESFELEMTALRADEPLPKGKFNPAHYRKIHHHLFQDVYSWAGRYRTVRTAKGGNWFAYPEHISKSMDKLFKRLNDKVFLPGTSKVEFVQAAAKFLAELNAVHPFREGNGRSQLAFLHLLGIRAGYPFKLEGVDRGTFLPAMIESFNGSTESLAAELAKLVD